ncbi:MAG TPA: hypothetical protein VME46_11120 [Acidimicrobiales bacterium]|nr:hypothetical protein [Acidimicrobiales bacterium]
MTKQLRHWAGLHRWHAGAAAALVAAAATIASSVAATATPASADGTTTTAGSPAVTTVPAFGGDLNRIKAQAAAWIAERIVTLNKEIAVVQARSDLGSDQAALVAEMQAAISGLEALGSTIAADTTVQKAREDARLIFTEFRVYLFMLPAVQDVMSTDNITNVQLPGLNKAITYLQGQENSSNHAVLGPLVANMQSQVQIAGGATSGLSAQLLSYTPAEWDANHGLLNGAAADINVAHRSVNAAVRDAQEAYRYLRHHTAPTTTTTAATTTTTAPTTTTTAPTTTTSTSTTSTTVPATTTTTTGNLAAIQAWAARMIAGRLATLETLLKRVQHDGYLGSDQATLENELNADISGLEALGTKIAGDTSAAEAQADASLIFADYRVYDLVVPVVGDVSYVDWVVNVKLPDINKQITYLQGQENAGNQAYLAPLVSNMQLQVSTATSATNGISAELLGYTAAQWDANHRLLAGANADIYVTNRAVSTAGSDYSRALRYLHRRHSH